jgi:hypothetical protein
MPATPASPDYPDPLAPSPALQPALVPLSVPPPEAVASGYEYFAFISYRHLDGIVARQLQEVVQHYHLPVAIRKEPPNVSPQVGISEIPPELSPVYLDKTDMPPGPLTELIKKALTASRYLIVVCSPNSAQSDWVGMEITFFGETLGRADRIIPVIIAGTPDNSDPAKRCFHPELLRLLPDERAIDLSELIDAQKGILPRKKKTVQDEHGQPVAEPCEAEQFYAQIVAKMLGLDWRKLYDFRQREKQLRAKEEELRIKKEEELRFKKRCAAIAFATIACLLTAFGVWDYFFHTKMEYFADYVDQGAVPHGISPLTKEQTERRASHYRFEHRAGKLRRVVHANSDGMPTDNELPILIYNDRPAIQELEWTGSRLSVTEYKNARNKTIRAFYWWTDPEETAENQRYGRAEIKENKTGGAGTSLAASFTSRDNLFNNLPEQARADIKAFKLTRDAKGRIIKKEFMQDNSYTKPAPDKDLIYGFAYTLEEASGRVLEVTFLGKDGKPFAKKSGVLKERYKYDERGNIEKITNIGSNGNPILNEGFWASVSLKWPKWEKAGETFEGTLLDAEENKAIGSHGHAQWIATFDAHGRAIEQTFHDTAGKLYLNEEKVAKKIIERNARGLITGGRYFDAQGKPCFNKEGVSITRQKYDEWGNVSEIESFDTQGNRCMNKYGWHKKISKYDANGNCLEYAHYDTAGQFCFDTEGVARSVIEYNRAGHLIGTTSYGLDGVTPCLNKEGWVKLERSYPPNQDIVIYRDAHGNPVRHHKGFSKIVYTYDARGREIEASSYEYDAKSGFKPCFSKKGFATVKIEYNDDSNEETRRFFDTAGNPCPNKDGIVIVKQKYDAWGRVIQWESFDKESNPRIVADWGFARRELTWDRNNITDIKNYGTDGKTLCFGKEGYARQERKHDARGRITKLTNYGPNGELCFDKDGAAIVETEYDPQERWTRNSFYGTDEKAVLNNMGYASSKTLYNDRNEKNQTDFLGTDGALCLNKRGFARQEQKYDARGNCTEESFSDTEGALCFEILRGDEEKEQKGQKNIDAIARIVKRYNANDRIEKETYFDTDGNLTLFEGYASLEKKYDPASGEISEMTYYGLDKTPCLNYDGYAKVEIKYDSSGNCVESRYYDVNGKLCVIDGGFSIRKAEYDTRGNQIKSSYFGTDEKLCFQDGGFSALKRKFDDRDREISIIFLGTDEKACYAEIGYAEQRKIFDEYGNLLKVSYFAPDGTPCLSKDGYAYCLQKNDEMGRTIEGEFYGMDGKLCIDARQGFAKWKKRFDVRGNEIVMECFGTDGKPCFNNGGYAKHTNTWNERGLLEKIEYFAPSGARCFVVASSILDTGGAAIVKMEYDKRGLTSKLRYFDADGNPCLNKKGVALETKIHDARGRPVERAFHGKNGEPCLSSDGVAVFRVRYDSRGRVVEESRYGTDGKTLRIHNKEKVARVVWEYNERGLVSRIAHYGVDGKLCYMEGSFSVAEMKYTPRGKIEEQSFYGPDGQRCLLKNRGNIAKIKSTYNDRAQMIETAFYGADGTPMLNDLSAARIKIEYDERGREVSREFLGLGGRPCENKQGVSKAKFGYDAKGNRIMIINHGTDGKPCVDSSGVAGIKRKYDAHGREIERQYLDLYGKLVVDKETKIAKWVTKFDKRGKETKTQFYDANDNLLPDAGRVYGYDARGHKNRETSYDAKWEVVGIEARLNNEFGHPLEQRFLDSTGKLRMTADGYAILRNKYDEHGNNIEQSYFDVNWNPCETKDGFHRDERKYENGEIVERRYFNVAGKPALQKGLYSVIKWAQNERGLPIEVSYYDIDGKTLRKNEEGYAKRTWRYNSLGLIIMAEFFDENQKLAFNKREGAARFEKKYDAAGRVVEFAFYNEYNKPSEVSVKAVEDYAFVCFKVRRMLDNNGILKKSIYFHNTGKVSSTVEKYNDFERRTELSFYDEKGKLCIHPEKGFAKLTLEYDKNRNLTKECVFDENGKPGNSNGPTFGTRRFDDSGRLLEVAFFDKNKAPYFNAATGFAKQIRKYDKDGDLMGQEFFDAQEKLCAPEPNISKMAKVIRIVKVTEKGKKAEMSSYDASGEKLCNNELGLAKSIQYFNNSGQEMEVSFFDENGNLVNHAYYGCYKCLRSYHPNGNKSELTVHTLIDGLNSSSKWKYNSEGSPVESVDEFSDSKGKAKRDLKSSLSKEITKFNNAGNKTEQIRYFVEDGENKNEDGIHHAIFKFDGEGNEIERAFFDKDGKLCLSKNLDIAKIKREFDSNGNKTKETYFGKEGERRDEKASGCAEIIWKYDDNGNNLEVAFFDSDGKPAVANGEVFSRKLTTYDADNNRHKETIYPSKDARANYTSVFDARGNLIEWASLGVDGKPLPDQNGNVRYTMEYNADGKRIVSSGHRLSKDGKTIYLDATVKFNAQGQPTERSFFDETGNLRLGKDGYAKIAWLYDTDGKVQKTILYDTKGQEIKK